jgi:cytochrome b561
MQDLPLSPDKLRFYSWHKWAGVTIFLLVLLRILWRLMHRPPGPPASIPVWQQRSANLVHFLLYVLMVAVPVSGWLMSSAKGVQTVWFGVLPLPDLLERNRELGDLLANVHQALNYTLAALVIVHVVAALQHHFIERRPFLQRMGLGRKERT